MGKQTMDFKIEILTVVISCLLHANQAVTIESAFNTREIKVDIQNRSAINNVSYVFDWDDGELTAKLLPIDIGVFNKQYTDNGYFDIQTICINGAAFDYSNTTVYSGETITRLESTYELFISPSIVTNITIPISFETGTDVTVSVKLLHTGYTERLLNINSGTHDVFLPKEELDSLGLFAVEIRVSNPKPPAMTIYSLISFMNPPIVTEIRYGPNDVSQSSDKYVITNESFSITASLSGGDVTFTVQILNSTQPDNTIPYDWQGYFCQNATEYVFNYSFISSGDYIIKIHVSNFGSSYDHPDIKVSSRTFPNGTISISNVSAFTDETLILEIVFHDVLDIDLNSISCESDFGDGNASDSGWPISTYMVRNYTYITPGQYELIVTCDFDESKNYINEKGERGMYWNRLILIENEVKNIVIEHDSTNISHHPASSPVTTYIRLLNNRPPLEDLSCLFVSQLEENGVPNKLIWNGSVTEYSNVNVTLPSFETAGRIELTINCSKQLSWQFFPPIVFEVYYDCWLSNYFDDVFRAPSHPRVTQTHKHFQIVADVKLNGMSVCQSQLELEWRVFDNQSNLLPVKSPNISTFWIAPYTLNAGLYKFELTTMLVEPELNLTDYTYVMITEPDLHAVITDGLVSTPVRKALRTDTIVLDSMASYDPAENPGGSSTNLQKSWTCYQFPHYTTEADIVASSIVDTYSTSKCSVIVLQDESKEGTHYIPPNSLQADTWYLFEVTITSGTREKIARQAILAVDKLPLTIEIECISNCLNSATARSKLREDNVELNAVILDNVVLATATTYLWTFERFNPPLKIFEDVSDRIIGSREKTGVKISGSRFKGEEGFKYQVSVRVKLEGNDAYGETTSYKQFVLNMPPYNGSCKIEGDIKTVAAGVDDVCITCMHWLDEGGKENREVNSDSGEALEYEVVQRYLKADKTINNIYRETMLESSKNLRRCVRLRLPEEDVDHTMIEVRIKDSWEKAYSTQQFVLQITAPTLSDDATNMSPLQQIIQRSSQRLNQARQLGDTSTLFTTITALASFQATVKVSTVRQTVNFVSGLTGDDSKVSVSDAMNAIQEPQTDESTEAVRQMKHTLLNNLIQGRQIQTEESKNDPITQISLVEAVSAIVDGDENALDNTILDETGKTIVEVIDNFDSIASKNSDSVRLRDLTEDIVHAMGKLSDGIVPDDTAYYMGITNEAEARELTAYMTDIDPMGQSKQDESLLTVDETNYFLLKQEQAIAQKMADRTEQSFQQFQRIENMLGEMTHSYPMSDGSVTTIGDPETSGSVVTMTRFSPEDVGTTTLQGTHTSVKLNGVYTSDSKVNIGIYEGSQPITAGIDPSVNTYISSKEVYINVDMDGDSFDGEIEVQFQVSSPSYVLTEQAIQEEDADILHRQKVYVRNTLDTLCLVVRPVDATVKKYKIWISCSGDVSKLHYDAVDDVSKETNWTKCFQPSELALSSPGVCSYGIETIKVDGDSTGSTNRWKRSVANESDSGNLALNITTATMAFLLWDDNRRAWSRDTCAMKWLEEENKLIGSCPPQQRMTCANSFYVAPNKIDFHAAFLRFSPKSQAAVLATLSSICVLYVLVVIWARHEDRKDLLKWGITPLVDNFAEDNYFYIIKVYTGLRPGAGTRSMVGFVVGGEDGDTGLRKMADGVRKEFPTGSVMNYLMAAPSYLGHLEYLRVWHDNSGEGRNAAWYLSRLEIQDVQKNETFTFLVERWLALDKEDGMLECVVPVCKVENLNVFRHRFNTNAKDTLADSHIWISIIYRPVTSHFTRVQRASCALVFLMLTMISNAMFYKSEENYETPAVAQIGPFHFTTQQIYISIICAFITTPTTLLLVYLFKLSRTTPHINKPFFKMFERASRYRIPFTESWIEKKYRESIELEQSILAKGNPKFEGFFLPRWFAVIAWVLFGIAVLLSSFFLLIYSMEWGRQKSQEWLTTFVLSFFESVFCLDPIKVIATAVLLSLVLRSSQDAGLVIDRETIMKTYKSSKRGKAGKIRLPAPPLNTERLAEARALKERDMRMTTAMKDIIINIIIIWISCSISYSTRDRWSYNMNQEIADSLLQGRSFDQHSFLDINTTLQYYDWLNNTAILNMFPENDASGQRLPWRMRQFLSGGAKLRVGPPRLRQLRITKKKCNNPYMRELPCYGAYSKWMEDNGNYCIGWRKKPCSPAENVYKHSSEAWEFTSALDIQGFPISGYHTTYGGGGYIAKLSVNREISQIILGELYNNSWIDHQTRSVLFEFTLYCLNTNIFSYNIFMAEFPETGGVFPYVMILPMRLHMHVGALGMYTLLCEVIYLVYLVIISVITGLSLIQQKIAFFKRPWQVYDFVYICISYGALVMYFIRMAMTNQSLGEFKQDPKEFVNFFHIAIWDQIYVTFVGILVSMATLRMLNVLGYNKRINTVVQVFTNAATQLTWFGIFFFYVYLSYAVFGYLLFGSKLKSYRNVYKALGTLFISMIGKSRFTEIDATDPVMSKIYFMIFIFLVVYMILTMFLAVLSKSIDQVHQNIKRTKRDEMVEYVINKCKCVLALYKWKAQDKSNEHSPWNKVSENKGVPEDCKDILKDISGAMKEALMQDKDETFTGIFKLNIRE